MLKLKQIGNIKMTSGNNSEKEIRKEISEKVNNVKKTVEDVEKFKDKILQINLEKKVKYKVISKSEN